MNQKHLQTKQYIVTLLRTFDKKRKQQTNKNSPTFF